TARNIGRTATTGIHAVSLIDNVMPRPVAGESAFAPKLHPTFNSTLLDYLGASTVASAMALSDAASRGKPAAAQASSAAASAAPNRGLFGKPRLRKSAARSGNAGTFQRWGSVASLCQDSSAVPWGERAHASNTRSMKRSRAR